MQGKTLSLLCSSLTWLSDQKERSRKGKMKEIVGGNDDLAGVPEALQLEMDLTSQL